MKKILSGTALLIVIFCFFKFGGIHKNNISIEQTSNQREKLTLWAYYEVEAQQKSLDKLIKDFNLSQDTYFLSWEYVPMTDFTKRLSLGFTENELPDLVIIDNPDMFTYITLGLFEDITEYMSNKQDINDYYPEVLHSVIYNGRYYGLPFCSNNVALYYNKDLFKKAGLEPPKTWDEFKEAAYILTDEDTYGFAMCAMNSEEGAFQFLPWILSTGATIETIGDQNAFRAYKILQELISMGALSGECINWTQIDVARKFIAGEAAMMENGPWVLPMVIESGINFGIVELPIDVQRVSVLGGENLAIIKGKNVAGAIAFLDYYRQEDVMLEICRTSHAIPPKRTLSNKTFGNDSLYSVFINQMEYGISRSSYRSWKKVSNIINESSYDLIVEGLSVQEICNDISKKLKKLNKK